MTTTDYEARAKFCEERIESLGEEVDPGDVFGILMAIWDAQDSGIPFYEWIDDSRLAGDIIEMTQSNHSKGRNRLRRMALLDESLMRYQDDDRDY